MPKALIDTQIRQSQASRYRCTICHRTFRHMTSRAGTDFRMLRDGVARTIPLGRQGRPEDVNGSAPMN